MTNRATGWAAQKDQYAVPVMFNPYTGEPRDVRDVQSDPQGILIAPPGRVEMLAATPSAKAADSVLEDAARYRWLREHRSIDLHANPSVPWVVRWEFQPIPTTTAIVGEALDAAIDAARKKGANHD